MKKLTTIDQLWENLKATNENTKRSIETSEKVISIIRKITDARIRLNISQRDLAKKCGIQQPALARIETFKIIPKINTLIKIAECVNISIEALNEQQKSNILKVSQFASVVMNLSYATGNNGGYVYNYGNNKKNDNNN